MMPILTSERKNALTLAGRQPIEGFRLFKAFSCEVTKRLLGKASSGYKRRFNAPIVISPTLLHLDLSKLPDLDIKAENDMPLAIIDLASKRLDATAPIKWRHYFRDQEDLFALHRFIWLLLALMEEPNLKRSQQALQWIEEWIDVMSFDESHPAWESYSVAERLANWPFILAIINKNIRIPGNIIAKIERSLQNHLKYLLHNLEHRGACTNNHILNDARGLYLGGVIMGHAKSIEVSKAIFQEWTPKLIHPDGMLKEHSSHYQWLISWRYAQMCQVASHIRDVDFVDFLKPWVRKIEEARDFFSVYSPEGFWEMPYLGDISPDISPVQLAKFKNVWGSYLSEPKLPLQTPLRTMHCGFCRYDVGDVSIFWHIEEDGLFYGGHGHYDLGSFVLFCKGRQVIADIGRHSYGRAGSLGRNSSAHNTILVDGVGAFCEEVWLNKLPKYKKQSVLWKTYLSKDKLTCHIKTDGFLRLPEPIIWERIFEVESQCLTITDNFKTSTHNHIDTCFYLDPQIRVEMNNEGALLIRDEEIKIRFCARGQFDSHYLKNVWCCKEYGHNDPTMSLVYSADITGNHSLQYKFCW